MNSYYREKALKTYPVLEERPEITSRGYIRNTILLKNTELGYLHEGVELDPAMTMARGILRKIEADDTMKSWRRLARIRNLFLVTDDETDAKKAACFISMLHCMAESKCGNGEEDTEEWFDHETEDLPDPGPAPVLFSMVERKNEKDSNSERDTRLARLISSAEGKKYVVFTGLGGASSLKEEVDIIRACPVDFKCIIVSERVSNAPEIRELICLDPEHNSMIRPGGADFEYYVRICKSLLEGGQASFNDEKELRYAIMQMMRHSGRAFSEEWLGAYLDRGTDGEHFDLNKMFEDRSDGELRSAMNKLGGMIGLKSVKTAIREMTELVREESRNPRLNLHRNMIFAGNPGSGKTTVAQLCAEIFAEAGIAKPIFVAPSRSDLIGKYVGHTAPKVREVFEAARGGVLFIDEAGFFLNERCGGFVTEAIREFVRYMELYPDVTVIFAMYDKEVSDFLDLDEGLRSRINRIVRFENYNVEELCDITEYMLREYGYEIEAGREVMKTYYTAERRKDGFGNARASRKLAESIILSMCMERKEQDKDMGMVIPEAVIRKGIGRLERENGKVRTSHSIGFLPVMSGNAPADNEEA